MVLGEAIFLIEQLTIFIQKNIFVFSSEEFMLIYYYG